MKKSDVPPVNCDVFIRESGTGEHYKAELVLTNGVVKKRGEDGLTNVLATLHSYAAARRYGLSLGYSVAM